MDQDSGSFGAGVRISIRALDQKGALEAIWEVSELVAEADGKVRDTERKVFLEIQAAITAIAKS